MLPALKPAMLAIGVVLTGLLAILTSCKTTDKDAESVFFASVHAESNLIGTTNLVEEITLPVSQKTISINKAPVFHGGNIVNVEMFKVDHFGQGILFQLNEAGARALFMATAENQGRRFVLVVNRRPIGVRIVDEVVRNGVWMTFTELDDEALEELVIGLRESIEPIQQSVRKN